MTDNQESSTDKLTGDRSYGSTGDEAGRHPQGAKEFLLDVQTKLQQLRQQLEQAEIDKTRK